MPRHRKDCVPRRRPQRRENGSGRGVPVNTGRAARLLDGRSARSLFVTPWFAAGMGILIAATLVLESPTDAVLSYGPISPGVPCRTHGCRATGPRHEPDSLAIAKPGVRLKVARTRRSGAAGGQSRRPASPAAPAAAAPGAVTVSFRVVQQGLGGFIAIITVSGSRSLGDWTLGFTIPGASIKGVGGARWRGDASGDGGVAQAQPEPWRQSRSPAKIARIVVFGTGTPGRPAGCTFDGTSCVLG
jgi:hypothetical protein